VSVRVSLDGVTFEAGAPFVTAWTGIDGLRKLALGPDVLSMSVSKDVNGISGRFSLELLPRSEFLTSEFSLRTPAERLPVYFRALAPNTPIAIGFEREGGVMLGLVESCDYSTTVVNAALQISIKVSGSDLGHMLEDHVLQALISTSDLGAWTAAITDVLGGDAPILTDLLGAEAPLNSAGERSLLNQSIDNVARYSIDRVAGMRIPVLRQAFGGKGYIGDFTQLRVASFDEDLVFKSDLYMQETSVSGYLQEILDKDFYEFRVETLPQDTGIPRPVLLIRPKPFDEEAFQGSAWPTISRNASAAWERLTTLVDGARHHEIETADLIGGVTLGRSRSEAYTYYTVQNNNEIGATDGDASAGMAFPIYDLYAATRYVTQRYDSRCSLVAGDPTDTTLQSKIRSSTQERRNRLFCWYRCNPEFLTGSVQVRGKDAYRAGDPVWIPWMVDPLSGRPGLRFYCTAVTHSWSVGGMYDCTLSLARGHGAGFWEEFVKRVTAVMPDTVPYGWISADR